MNTRKGSMPTDAERFVGALVKEMRKKGRIESERKMESGSS